MTSHENKDGPSYARAYPSFCSMKKLRTSIFHPGWDASPSQFYPSTFFGTHFYTSIAWVKNGTVIVWCVAQKQNTISPARARTRITPQRDPAPYSEMQAYAIHALYE